MENNNNGRGIFYGVIGVATLIVAIIGATFAYFSASITGQNNVQAGTTSINLEWNTAETIVTGLKDDLIPIDTDGVGVVWETEIKKTETQTKDTNDYEELFAKAAGIDASKCRDDVGNSICSVYQFTITNPSTTTQQTIYGNINTAVATTMDDLYFAMFVGTADKVRSNPEGFNVHGTKEQAEDIIPTGTAKASRGAGLIHGATKVKDLVVGNVTDTDSTKWTNIPNSRKILAPLESVTYTIIVWLEESYESQETQENQSWAGNIMFNTGYGSGVTGQLKVGGNATK